MDKRVDRTLIQPKDELSRLQILESDIAERHPPKIVVLSTPGSRSEAFYRMARSMKAAEVGIVAFGQAIRAAKPPLDSIISVLNTYKIQDMLHARDDVSFKVRVHWRGRKFCWRMQ